jgi:integrase
MAAIKIKGVKAYVSNGQVYAYHRKSGIRLLELYGSPAFFAELGGAEKKYREAHKPAEAKPGTWGDLVRKYKEFYLPTKALRTQKDYNRVLNWLASLDGMPLKDWSRAFAMKLRDKAFEAHGRRFANYVMAVAQGVFSWGLDREFVAEQPIQKIKVIKRPKSMPRANRPWSREEWDAVVSATPAHLRAPILLCGVLGWREGEAIKRPRDDYDRGAKKIKRVSSKSGKLVKTPVPKLIYEALDVLFPHNAITLLVNSRGKPWTSDGFRTSFFKLIRRLERDGKVGPGLTVHGLRHTCGTLMRELGFDLQTIADMLGQEEPGMAGWYSRDAELEGKLENVVEKIDQHLSRA